ncbi:unnamed protein product [Rhizoctonia solani]|uniref:Survival protein SurE-like phosphatase/nucleotidase domain-containing protein n=1 Tax=Rhizoctonia solani TaxID=456999 RepID=A0A8H3E051_9AGAM|nr:unnamed protein product [Rhizoctonia solani]
MATRPIRVLLTNDDGPPARDSPYVLGLYLELKKLGWDIRVVIPASQKSWIGKAYVIHDVVYGQHFYPKEDGTGEMCNASRPLKSGEAGEWILFEGTPATCTNIALHNLYPGEIDLVISGPNFGINTGSAFALSSGTIGAAMSGALSQMRSIALSYGTFRGVALPEYTVPAHALAGRIIKRLWENWGTDQHGLRPNEVDLYNVNIPMTSQLLRPEGIGVCWTTLRRNSYGRLFHPRKESDTGASRVESEAPSPVTTTAISDQPNIPPHNQLKPGPEDRISKPNQHISAPGRIRTSSTHLQQSKIAFTFSYSYDVRNSAHPPLKGTDLWAINNSIASVTPMRAVFCLGGEGEITAGSTWHW